jgi:hypothetical protein
VRDAEQKGNVVQVSALSQSVGEQRPIPIKKQIEEGELAELLLRFAEQDKGQLFAILDAARTDEILAQIAKPEAQYQSLFRGREEEQLFDVSPFLVVCKADTELFTWLTSEAWAQSVGVFFTSADSFENLFAHFQQFLMVQEEGGGDMYFRFYDPRVLRVYLPTCTAEEIRTFFGNIRRFMAESEDGKSILSFVPGRSGSASTRR